MSVRNRGYDPKKKKWVEYKGKARFIGDKDVGNLEVSFVWLLWTGYVIYYLDEGYNYAFITDPDQEYLWFLAREKQVSDAMIAQFESQAKEMGFPVDELIYVQQLPMPKEKQPW